MFRVCCLLTLEICRSTPSRRRHPASGRVAYASDRLSLEALLTAPKRSCKLGLHAPFVRDQANQIPASEMDFIRSPEYSIRAVAVRACGCLRLYARDTIASPPRLL